MGLKYKRPIKFVGVDSFHRAIFEECGLKNFYGCIDILFNRDDTEETVLNKISVKDLTFFGSKFGCEPMGTPINDIKIIKGEDMPRVYHVKSARKKNPVAEVGEPYFWWKSFGSPKRFSKERPSRSMLTNSPFLSQVYDLEDSIIPNIVDPNDLSDAISQIEEIMSETENSRDNMPEHLQDVGIGEMLGERISSCESWIDELQEIQDEYQDMNDLPDDAIENKHEEFQDALNECVYQGE